MKKKPRKYRELKESIGIMKSQRSNVKINKLIEDSKRIAVNEII